MIRLLHLSGGAIHLFQCQWRIVIASQNQLVHGKRTHIGEGESCALVRAAVHKAIADDEALAFAQCCAELGGGRIPFVNTGIMAAHSIGIFTHSICTVAREFLQRQDDMSFFQTHDKVHTGDDFVFTVI